MSTDKLMKIRHELYAVSILLVICAVLFAYKAFEDTSEDFIGETQTIIETVSESEFKSAFAVNVNIASREELLGVKGITENLADAIIDYRNKNGRFIDISELLNVKGIGKATFEKLKPYITV